MKHYFHLRILWLFLLAVSLKSPAQSYRMGPPGWWTGMKNPCLQLLLYGKNISKNEVRIRIPGVKLQSILPVPNPNYLFLNLAIDENALPGDYPLDILSKGKVVYSFSFSLRERAKASADRKGFDASDVIYLIMPDRFANGDPANDNIPGMLEKMDRSAPYGRHGGDLQGIMQHLDYIENLGVTAIWLNPIQENNQEHSSYHGYSITDYYKVDPRLGTNEQFRQLVAECHSRNIKVIMDMVMNHCGSNHWWMRDLPSPDWINQFPEFTRSNYRLSTISDPHAARADYELATRGWFDATMPDLNLQNTQLLTYLIQNTIWWIEYAGIDGIRMDTYPYPDPEGMRQWVNAVMLEYPQFNIVGEAWFTDNSKLAYWQKDAPNLNRFNSGLPSLMDFPLTMAIHQAFNEGPGWGTGMQRLYDILADDFLFPDPDRLVIFAENHDLGRIYEYLGKDEKKFRVVIAFLATVRGIPQIYYGSELLMDGDGNKGHAFIRQDFPGGWPGDSLDAFTSKGRTPQQNAMIEYVSRLMNFRKTHPVLHYGRMIHFVPENNVYVYFRVLEKEAIMVVLNNGGSDQMLSTGRYSEVLNSYSSGKDIITGEVFPNLRIIPVASQTARIIELKYVE